MKNKILLFIPLSIILCLYSVNCSVSSVQEHPSGIKVAFEIGSIAPNFTARDLQGNQWELWELKGKKVILSFWTINSTRSKLQLEEFQEFYEIMDKDKIVLLGMTCQEQEGDLIPFLIRRKIIYPNLIDRMGNICRLYDVSIIRGLASQGASPFPFTVFINEESIIENIYFIQIGKYTLMEFADMD